MKIKDRPGGMKEYQRQWYRDHKEEHDARSRVWNRDNKERAQELGRAYYEANIEKMKLRQLNYKSSNVGKGRQGDSGYAAELIVRTDLLLRGLDVTVPENRACPDDVHFRSTRGWISVQVKVAQVHKETGNWVKQNRRGKRITSDLLAWVGLRDRVIRYEPNAKPIPKELR